MLSYVIAILKRAENSHLKKGDKQLTLHRCKFKRFMEFYLTFDYAKCDFSLTNYCAIGIELKSQATCVFCLEKALLTKVSGTDRLLKQ